MRHDRDSQTSANLGTASNCTPTEYGNGTIHRTVLDGISTSLTVTSSGTEVIGLELYEFPEGVVLVDAVLVDLVVTGAPGLGAGSLGLGSAAATAGTGLAGTEVTHLAAADVTPALAGTDVERNAAGAGVVDGTATAGKVFLNIADKAGGWDAAGTFTVTGRVELLWKYAGDY